MICASPHLSPLKDPWDCAVGTWTSARSGTLRSEPLRSMTVS